MLEPPGKPLRVPHPRCVLVFAARVGCGQAEPTRRSIVIPQDTNGKQNVERNLKPEGDCFRTAMNRGRIRTGALRGGAVDSWRRLVAFYGAHRESIGHARDR